MYVLPRNYGPPKPCDDCGLATGKRHQYGKCNLCLDCSEQRATRAAIEMSTKAGPAWESFLATRGPFGRPPRTRT